MIIIDIDETLACRSFRNKYFTDRPQKSSSKLINISKIIRDKGMMYIDEFYIFSTLDLQALLVKGLRGRQCVNVLSAALISNSRLVVQFRKFCNVAINFTKKFVTL